MDLASGRLQIVRRRFAGAPVGDDLVDDLLPFMKVMHAGPFDRADMYEHIRPAAIRLNEPEAFGCIEPLYCAGRHGESLSIGGRTYLSRDSLQGLTRSGRHAIPSRYT